MRNSSDTRNRILDVAQDLIQRRGLNAMSFQDLSDAIGIKKASVHYHFPSKDSMVSALIHRYLDDFDTVVQEILDSQVKGKTKLKRYCSLFTTTLASETNEKSCLCGMLIAEMFSLDKEGLSLVRTFLRRNGEYIRQIVKTGVDDGSLAKQSNVDSTSEMVLATLEGGLLLARCDGGPDRFAEVVKRLIASLSTN